MLLFVTLWIYVKYLLNQIHRSKESNVVPVTRGNRKWESFANRWNWKGYENLLIHKRSRDLLFDTVPVSAYFLLLRTQNYTLGKQSRPEVMWTQQSWSGAEGLHLEVIPLPGVLRWCRPPYGQDSKHVCECSALSPSSHETTQIWYLV